MKPGRNDPCACGSGKKYKHCCLAADATPSTEDMAWRRVRRELEGQPGRMLRFTVEAYGEDALREAWSEFQCWDAEAGSFDPESPHVPVFMPWFFHAWSPEAGETWVNDAALHDTPPTAALLQRRGARLAPVLREYLTSCLEHVFSFYEIERCDPGRGFALRDVLTGEACDVLERSGSQQLRAGELIYAQLATAQGATLVEAMGPVALPPIDKIEIIELRRRLRGDGGPIEPVQLRDWAFELRQLYLSLTDRLLHPPLPQLQTTDGEVMEPHTLVFEIDSAQRAFEALKHLDTQSTEAELLAGAERDAGGEVQRVELTWSRLGNRIHSTWSNTVLGRVRIDGRRMTADVHSRERAEAFKAIVAEVLGPQARLRLDQVQSIEAMMRESAAGESMPSELQQRPEVQALIAQHLQRHYEAWVDTAVPALGGRTPRAAVAEPDGREQVEALIRQMERNGTQDQPALDRAVFRRVRASLGLPES